MQFTRFPSIHTQYYLFLSPKYSVHTVLYSCVYVYTRLLTRFWSSQPPLRDVTREADNVARRLHLTKLFWSDIKPWLSRVGEAPPTPQPAAHSTLPPVSVPVLPPAQHPRTMVHDLSGNYEPMIELWSPDRGAHVHWADAPLPIPAATTATTTGTRQGTASVAASTKVTAAKSAAVAGVGEGAGGGGGREKADAGAGAGAGGARQAGSPARTPPRHAKKQPGYCEWCKVRHSDISTVTDDELEGGDTRQHTPTHSSLVASPTHTLSILRQLDTPSTKVPASPCAKKASLPR